MNIVYILILRLEMLRLLGLLFIRLYLVGFNNSVEIRFLEMNKLSSNMVLIWLVILVIVLWAVNVMLFCK